MNTEATTALCGLTGRGTGRAIAVERAGQGLDGLNGAQGVPEPAPDQREGEGRLTGAY